MIAKVYTNCSLLVILLLAPFLIFSQQKRVSTESFDVEKSPIIILDLSHSTVIIETWNKNRVEVKTTLTSKEEDKQALNEAFDASEIKVLGNSKRVEITSRKNRNANPKWCWVFPNSCSSKTTKITKSSTSTKTTKASARNRFRLRGFLKNRGENI